MTRKKSNYIEITFGNAFEFKGLSEDLVPTIKAIEINLMPLMLSGHEQNKELHILTLQANGGIMANQIDCNDPGVL